MPNVTSYGSLGGSIETAEITDGSVTPQKLSFEGMYQLVEEKSPASNSTSIDFDTTLDGNADGGYMLMLYCMNATGSAAGISLRANGSQWATNKQQIQGSGASISGNAGAGADIGSMGANDDALIKVELPFMQTGLNARKFISNEVRTDSNMSIFGGDITTPNVSTNITSLGVQASVGSSLSTTSVFRLYKLIK
jgi:hypothetical protein